MLALRQPMAQDLREIVGALKAASMLERIGDYAKNVAKRTAALVEMPPVPSAQTVRAPGQPGAGNDQGRARRLHRPRRRQGRAASASATRSSTRCYTSIFRELLTYMMEDPRNITACTHLLFIAKNIERIGDHATNIAEMVHFLVHGRHAADQRPKEDIVELYRCATLSEGCACR